VTVALADYFHRSAVAAAQVLDGYDEDLIAERLDAVPVAIVIDDLALEREEGRDLLDLTVRLLARLYPSLTIVASRAADPWRHLALSINPAIDLDQHEPSAAIVIGTPPPRVPVAPIQFFAGSDGWHARFSTRDAQPVGTTANPLGPGAAACVAAANLFRHVFLTDAAHDDDLVFCTRTMQRGDGGKGGVAMRPAGTTVLVGAGAIGNGALWAMGRIPDGGGTVVVDSEVVELSNLQRYVLAVRDDEGRLKTDIACAHLPAGSGRGIPLAWATFTAEQGHNWEHVLAAVDSAAARHAVQASLPKWVANGWTQPGDLGVSVHPWTGSGACVSCLYLPAGPLPDEDDLIADALGLSRERDGLEIRTLLDSGAPPPREFLARVAASLGQPLDRLRAFESRPLRDLYVHGVCGGSVLPLSRIGTPAQPVHVPLAHQSALAGVLLAARLASWSDTPIATTLVTRLNVLRRVPAHATQPAQKDPRGLCICQDPDYQRSWREKWVEQRP
jgi:hypothetical protein